jgi:hypothetical protein
MNITHYAECAWPHVKRSRDLTGNCCLLFGKDALQRLGMVSLPVLRGKNLLKNPVQPDFWQEDHPLSIK